MTNETGWNYTVREKQQQLNSVAEWAGIVGIGCVRDACRTAIHLLDRELERTRDDIEQREHAASHDGSGRECSK